MGGCGVDIILFEDALRCRLNVSMRPRNISIAYHDSLYYETPDKCNKC